MKLDWITENRYQVMKVLAINGELRLQQIADRLQKKPSQTHTTCSNLVELGVVERNDSSKTYKLTGTGLQVRDKLKKVKEIESEL